MEFPEWLAELGYTIIDWIEDLIPPEILGSDQL